jgi:hypothetical protein
VSSTVTGTTGPAARLPVPGPRGHWWRGCLPRYRQDPLGFYVQVWREHGDYLLARHPAIQEDVYAEVHGR